MEELSALSGTSSPEDSSLFGTLGTGAVALLTISAAAPLGATVAVGPVAVIFGNGAGLPGAFLLTGLFLFCFAVGYSALAAEIPGNGAFYRYITVVFGHRVGMGTACVSLASYLMMTAALATLTGYFVDLSAQSFGIHIGAQAWIIMSMIAVAAFGIRNIDVAAKVVVPLIICEFGALSILIIAIVAHKGINSFPVEAVSPSTVFSPGFGISVMFALSAFVGVESAALYSAEAKNPKTAIPRATIIAVGLVGLFYFITFWAFIGDIGIDHVAAIAQKGLTDVNIQQSLFLDSFGKNLGPIAEKIISLMIATSSFAAFLSLHNAATRYVFTLGDARILPRRFGVASAKAGSPATASIAVSVFVAVVTLALISSRVDYVTAFAPTIALGTTGIIVLQGIVAFATVFYFRRRKDPRIFTTFILPLIGFIGICSAFFLTLSNYDVLSGSSSTIINSMPLVFILIFAYGCITGRGRSEKNAS
ncbi:APC family permease [Paraburkholderia bannensis]|uniref:APC family permease n=1 Tax=Paraburkholderia bannensis TaxID=765414 RepID=UPI002AB040FB|nr:APC family permease [Paraburkholderia bannensis]